MELRRVTAKRRAIKVTCKASLGKASLNNSGPKDEAEVIAKGQSNVNRKVRVARDAFAKTAAWHETSEELSEELED
jgi:hypothetical protein